MDLATKVGKPVLYRVEEAFKRWAVPRCPRCVETHHLTGLTLLWSLLVVLCGVAAWETRWTLAFLPLLVVAQYVTDVLDGAIGRARETGLVRWGWYADHVFDALFVGAVTTAWVAATIRPVGIMALLLPCGPMMCVIHAYVFSAASDQVRIYFGRLGPTEGRIWLIVQTLALAFCRAESLPWVVAAAIGLPLICLAGLFLHAHFRLWDIDLIGRPWPRTILTSLTHRMILIARRAEAPHAQPR